MNKIKQWLKKMDQTKRITFLFVVFSFVLIFSLTLMNGLSANHRNEKEAKSKIAEVEKKKNDKKEVKQIKKQEEKSIETVEKEEESTKKTEDNTENVPVAQKETVKEETKPNPLIKEGPVKPQETMIQVSISIEGMDGVMASSTLSLKEGASVYDALVQITSMYNMELNSRESWGGVYISAINGLKEFAHGKTSGWTYYVDGVFINQSCSAYTLKNNQNVRWVYVHD